MADETKIIRIVVDSSRAVDGSAAATRALQNMEKATASMDQSMLNMEKSLGRVGGYLKANLALVIAEIAAKMLDLAKSAIQAAGDMGELAETMGVTVRGLQGLQFTAVQNRVSLEQLETGVAKFSQKIGEAANGSKPMIDALNSLGVKILDVSGKLLPTEELMSNVAAAVLKIEDPARRTAASIEFFGKAGAKFQPVLQDLAKGFSYMGEQAEKAGAMISQHAVDRLDKLGDSASRAALTMRAMFAEAAAALLDLSDKYTAYLAREQAKQEERAQAGRDGELAFRNWMDSALSSAVGVAAGVAEAFRGAQEQIVKYFIDGFNNILKAAEAMINSVASITLPNMFGSGTYHPFGTVNLGQIPGGGASASDYIGGINSAATNAQTAAQAYYARQRAAQSGGGGAGYGGTEPASGTVTISLGVGNPTAVGGGGGSTKAEVDEIGKLIDKIAKDAERMRQSFDDGTVALQAQNEYAAAELKLIDAAPAVREHELALIRATNEAKKDGVDLESQAFKDRVAALEQGEQIKTQQQELKRAQELWTEPLKQALRDIQQIGADAFEQMLESGKISFEGLSQTFTKIIRRMAAEFLALATIRPVMSVLVNAISPSMAGQMGLSSGSSGGIGSIFGGGGGGGTSFSGGGSLFGGGGISGALGDFGSWLNTPFVGGYAGVSPVGAGVFGPAPNIGSSFGISPLGALGAIGGVGMGAYQLLSGNGSTSSTIGGISSMVGALASLIPGIGPIVGPLIGLAGNILPGLFGMDGAPPKITNQGYGQLAYGANGFGTSGGAWGPSANASGLQSSLGSMGQTMQGVFNALGGVKDPNKVWGVALESFAQSQGKDNFANQTSFLVDPNGNKSQWGQGSNDTDIGLQAAGVSATLQSILGGAVGAISENLRKGLSTINLDGHGTFDQIGTVITQIKAFDDAIAGLNKTVTTAESAVAQIDQSFAAMYATAAQYGLSTTDVDTAKAKARLGYATDFGKSLSGQILAINDPQAAAMQELDAWKQTLVDNNKWLIDNVTGALDQINSIEELYGLRRTAIVEQYAQQTAAAVQQALGGLKTGLDRLLYGDLSGASPTDALAGLKGTYNATLAQAFTGNADAAGRLSGATSDYAQALAKQYGTASTEYQSYRRQLIIDNASAYRINGGQFGDIPGGYDVIMGNSLNNIGTPSSSSTAALSAVLNQLGDTAQSINDNTASDGELKADVRELIDLMQRIAVKIAA